VTPGVPALDAWLFDLDGVVTDTARVHASAWQATFDEVLQELATGASCAPFDPDADYEYYVDGKPRADGVRDFLTARGIELPEGERSDRPDLMTIWGVGNRKNQLLLELLSRQAPVVFPGSVLFVHMVRGAGLRTAVVSASENCRSVLEAAHIAALFDVVVDGVVAARNHLSGKPAPDTYLWAAQQLEVHPRRAAVVEDAVVGVVAGKRGGFGWVVGVARRASVADLATAVADVVVADLAELIEDVSALRPHGGGRERPPVGEHG
jgi:beta-phosphoglucomutase family hydrolase